MDAMYEQLMRDVETSNRQMGLLHDGTLFVIATWGVKTTTFLPSVSPDCTTYVLRKLNSSTPSPVRSHPVRACLEFRQFHPGVYSITVVEPGSDGQVLSPMTLVSRQHLGHTYKWANRNDRRKGYDLQLRFYMRTTRHAGTLRPDANIDHEVQQGHQYSYTDQTRHCIDECSNCIHTYMVATQLTSAAVRDVTDRSMALLHHEHATDIRWYTVSTQT